MRCARDVEYVKNGLCEVTDEKIDFVKEWRHQQGAHLLYTQFYSKAIARYFTRYLLVTREKHVTTFSVSYRSWSLLPQYMCAYGYSLVLFYSHKCS